MNIDDKLFRIYEEANATTHKTKGDLARAVAAKQLIEFSNEKRNGERQYHTWGTIYEYVSLLAEYGLLNSENAPAIKTSKISRKGFDLTLGESVETYASNNGFSSERIRDAVKGLLQRTPAQLPTPPAVYNALQLPIGSKVFTKSVSVKAYQIRVNVNTKIKNVLIIPDILRD
ncbi:hypothetical protein [Caulobacter segnis]